MFQGTHRLRPVQGQRAAESRTAFQVRRHPARHERVGRRVVAGAQTRTGRRGGLPGHHPQQKQVLTALSEGFGGTIPRDVGRVSPINCILFQG